MSFESMGLHPALSRALADAGYTQPTEVQSRAIPAALAGGDLMVSSRTGSGKTASFALPALARVLLARERGPARGPRVLVLTPTRELALQVARAFADYGRHVSGLRVCTVVGGVPYGAQLKALRGPLDVLIATPGRLMDHMASGRAMLGAVELLVLDEADRMLDMGFIDDIRHVTSALPPARQTVLVSATFAGPVGRLAADLMRDPQRVEVTSHTEAHADIEQRLHWADDLRHKDALLDHVLTGREVEQAVVFTRTQLEAERVAQRLAEVGHSVDCLHGGMPQGRRNRVLQALRTRRLRVLVATDVAARGIDVPTISHVVNYGLPLKAEDYVHRIGRTGRAGRQGLAVTLAEHRDRGMIQRIQHFTRQRIPLSVVAGLEPRRVQPADRPAPRQPGAGPEHRPFKPGFRSPGARPRTSASHSAESRHPPRGRRSPAAGG